MNWQERDLKHIWHPCSQMKDYEDMPPIIIDRADGIYLYDISGKKYIDAISSWWCNLLGHCNKRINSAVINQIGKLEHVIFCNFSHVPAVTLCEKLAEVMPVGISKFNFTDNGSSSIESAMKMSFQYHLQSGRSNKKRFMALTGAYHGETIGALSACGCGEYSSLFKPIMPDIIQIEGPDCYRCCYGLSRDKCHAPCFEHAEKSFDRYGKDTCAFLIEPLVQAAAGMRIYPPEYLRKLRAACDAFNIHLIADEIATGFGRTGKMFACDHAKISPDIICMSKGLTGGYLPMAIAGTTQDIYDAFYDDFKTGKAFLHSHTYSGNPLACAAAIEVLNILQDEDIINNAADAAPYFTKLISDRISSHANVGEIRTIGLINAIELVEDRDTKKPFCKDKRIGRKIYQKALEKGLLLKPLGDVLYFNPPLTINSDEMKSAADICAESICAILGNHKYNESFT